jgi:hypothetical protein
MSEIDPVIVASKMGMLPEPSKEFLEAFREGSAGMVVECDFCGRVYFATDDGGDFEEGELEDLRARAEKEPDKCIEVSGFATRIIVNGKYYAEGCKCNLIRPYEDFIWLHRRGILAYIKARSEKRLKAAKEDAEATEATMTAAVMADETATEERLLLRKLLNKYPDENGVYSIGESVG